MRTADFDYRLPQELIAQSPARRRDQSRLLVLRRWDESLAHHPFSDFPALLRNGDVLVVNDSKVLAARLRGRNVRTGGAFEVLLLEENAVNDWWCLVRPGKRARLQSRIDLENHGGELTGLHATVVEINAEGHRRLLFGVTANIADELSRIGEVPLPPYIKRTSSADWTEDLERYQTIYARAGGSVAAPTAGLHFTEPVLDSIRRAGVTVCNVTLHVGLGTFAPVKTETLSAHIMHEERYVMSADTAHALARARRERRRIVAVGTTTLRALESAVDERGEIRSGAGHTRLFVHPPFRFQVVDALLTNFHLPRSTLLMLVSAFATPGETRGRDFILRAYAEAVRHRYRFFSYGDAMFIE